MAITKVAEAANSGSVAGGTGIAVTHGFSLVNGDVLYAFCGTGVAASGSPQLITAYASSGWTELTGSFEQQAGGNDRSGSILRKVITNAGGEPSSYTFTRTGDATNPFVQKVIIYQLRGVDTATPEDASAVKNNGSDDFTPDNVDITTVATGAMVLIAHLAAFGDTEAITGVTPGAPSGYTLGSNCAPVDPSAGSAPRGIMLATAHAIPGTAGAQSIGVWTHTPDEATREYITWAVSVKPLATAAAGRITGGGFF